MFKFWKFFNFQNKKSIFSQKLTSVTSIFIGYTYVRRKAATVKREEFDGSKRSHIESFATKN